MDYANLYFKVKAIEDIGSWIVVGVIFALFVLFWAYIWIRDSIAKIKNRKHKEHRDDS